MSTPRDEAALAGRMAMEMQKKLALHSDRRHWRESSRGYLYERLREEVGELWELVSNPDQIDNIDELWAEAADVANFAAMLADWFAPTQAEKLASY